MKFIRHIFVGNFAILTRRKAFELNVLRVIYSLLGIAIYVFSPPAWRDFLSPPPALFWSAIDFIPESLVMGLLFSVLLSHVLEVGYLDSPYRANRLTGWRKYAPSVCAILSVVVLLSGKSSWAVVYFPFLAVVETFFYLRISQSR